MDLRDLAWIRNTCITTHRPQVMRRTFKDDDLQSQLDEKGYVLIDNALSDEQMDRLEEFYMGTLTVRQDKDFANISSVHDDNIRVNMTRVIVGEFESFVNQYFDDHHQVAGHFIAKHPGPNTALNVHQDFSIVDESQYRSVTIWVPLVDVVEDEIGLLEVLEGSHKLENEYRSHTLKTPYSRVLNEFAFCDTDSSLMPTANEQRLGKALQGAFKAIPVKRGQCLVFDTKLLHRSSALKKDIIRIAAAGLVAPKEAELYHYFGTPDGEIKQYQVDKSFFTQYIAGDEPDQFELKKVFTYDLSKLRPADEALLYQLAGIEPLPEQEEIEETRENSSDGFMGRLKKKLTGLFA